MVLPRWRSKFFANESNQVTFSRATRFIRFTYWSWAMKRGTPFQNWHVYYRHGMNSMGRLPFFGEQSKGAEHVSFCIVSFHALRI